MLYFWEEATSCLSASSPQHTLQQLPLLFLGRDKWFSTGPLTPCGSTTCYDMADSCIRGDWGSIPAWCAGEALMKVCPQTLLKHGELATLPQHRTTWWTKLLDELLDDRTRGQLGVMHGDTETDHKEDWRRGPEETMIMEQANFFPDLSGWRELSPINRFNGELPRHAQSIGTIIHGKYSRVLQTNKKTMLAWWFLFWGLMAFQLHNPH